MFYASDFKITYRTTEILQGDYTLKFKMFVSYAYGFFDVYVDGVKIGNTINIASKTGDSEGSNAFEIGDICLTGYEEHEVSIESVTPCRLYWDYLQFVPF
jgi:hypothetical protein